ncbi:MAG TPA: hypothetical protein VK731_06175, partial [Candidatus Cybelea sp.]|nr:hypothetical protein [Candidatus Cybelea sp.]
CGVEPANPLKSLIGNVYRPAGDGHSDIGKRRGECSCLTSPPSLEGRAMNELCHVHHLEEIARVDHHFLNDLLNVDSLVGWLYSDPGALAGRPDVPNLFIHIVNSNWSISASLREIDTRMHAPNPNYDPA